MNATQLSKPSTTHETSVVNKVRHFQDGIFRALKQARKHARGQPMMVEKFQEIRDLVEQLEGQGIPFKTSRNTQMNRSVREILNQRANSTADERKSRRKNISADAIQNWLREVRRLRAISNHFCTYLYAKSL
jgi:hypothetical protein